MASNLSKRINIGKDTEKKLIQVGINSFEELEALGTEQVFMRLQALDSGACVCLLYSIDGAISDIKWNKLSPERKLELQEFHKRVQQK